MANGPVVRQPFWSLAALDQAPEKGSNPGGISQGIAGGGFRAAGRIIRVMEEFDLDIFTRMSGHSLDEFRPRLRHFATSGVRIPYLAAEDLILVNKTPGTRRTNWT
jgi:hypothetical protein